jgi:adenylyltransferase/sulfurtransferase
MKEVTVLELKAMIDNGDDFVLIDVREPFEFEEANINGILIPMGEVTERLSDIPKDKLVVVHCRSGARSANVINYLTQNEGYTNLANLKGGIKAWAAEIDPSKSVS